MDEVGHTRSYWQIEWQTAGGLTCYSYEEIQPLMELAAAGRLPQCRKITRFDTTNLYIGEDPYRGR